MRTCPDCPATVEIDLGKHVVNPGSNLENGLAPGTAHAQQAPLVSAAMLQSAPRLALVFRRGWINPKTRFPIWGRGDGKLEHIRASSNDHPQGLATGGFDGALRGKNMQNHGKTAQNQKKHYPTPTFCIAPRDLQHAQIAKAPQQPNPSQRNQHPTKNPKPPDNG